ncbi:D-alanyl-D-alanine carboxypeptidase family protein [Desulfopila sp. IMCC35008]|uniref:D-alanyl-D-alanine carboxypeptidase family protein n=1 Tax=Desulfopila sp. IMCC35008 TaxID=2653858 RepID=UPI0013CF699C|nr:D-alanyl-D-alanine carboxypeptidase [Desulfopila sp. IMCC35008]
MDSRKLPSPRTVQTSSMIYFSDHNCSRHHFRILPFVFFCFFLLLLPAAMAADKTGSPSPIILGIPGNISKYKKLPFDSDLERTNRTVKKRISARSAIVIDPVGNRTLFAKAPDMPRQPASTIKILTGTIALQSLIGEEDVPVSHEAASRPSSKMYLDPKRSYFADDLISGVLLASANDASVALAELIAGDEAAFAQQMTLQAEIWGASNTVCKTATGLTAKGQTSTARDLALILKHAMLNEEFSSRIRKRAMETKDGDKFYNHNKALWQITGTEGGKTGYTNAARQTYVGKFKRGEAEIIVAIMGSETMWSDLKYLVGYGFKQFQYIPATPADKNNLLAGGVTASHGSNTL